MAEEVAETTGIDPSDSPRSPGEKEPQDGVDYAEGDEGEEAAGGADDWQDIPEGSKFECEFKWHILWFFSLIKYFQLIKLVSIRFVPNTIYYGTEIK